MRRPNEISFDECVCVLIGVDQKQTRVKQRRLRANELAPLTLMLLFVHAIAELYHIEKIMCI